MAQNNLKIAIQKSGRLTEDSLDLLQKSGFDCEVYDGKLVSVCSTFPLEILFLRDDDIPEYVQDGVCDAGIVGLNMVREKNKNVKVLEKLGFAKCRLAIAVPNGSDIDSLAALQGKRIATSYSESLKRYLLEKGIQAEIVIIRGSVEIAPRLNIADAVCDLVSTGSTLKSNGLAVIDAVFESEAVMIGREKNNEDISSLMNGFLMRAWAVLEARRTKYIMLNAPQGKLQEITALIPGCKSPTVTPLCEEGWVSVQSVVSEDRFWEVVGNLKSAGARDILVLPIEKIVR